jgi:hypothetical protein
MRKTRIYKQLPLIVNIQSKHTKKAVRSNPSECVVAQALLEHFGNAHKKITDVRVGSTRTNVVMGDKMVGYKTPYEFRKAIPNFDRTGEWEVPEGEYVFTPVMKSIVIKKGKKPSGKPTPRARVYAKKTRKIACDY